MTSPRIWSLWDMLEFGAARFVSAVAHISSLEHYIRGAVIGKGGNPTLQMDGEDFSNLMQSLENLSADLSAMNLQVSNYKIAELRSFIHQAFEESSSVDISGDVLLLKLNDIFGRIKDELRTRKFYIITAADEKLYSPAESLLGDRTESAFPSSVAEFNEAAKCRALGRWTASVMHLMRALEPAILALQAMVEVDKPKEHWGGIIDQIGAKIKATPAHPDHAWQSEASLQFFFFKDAWRNYAMHGKERYDEERNTVIYNSVRAFLRHLSARLSEQDQT